MDNAKKTSWDSICNAFNQQYHYNIEVDITRRDLETTKQQYRESFSSFLTRWRAKAAQIINRPTEQEQIDIVIKNLLPAYQTRLQTQYLPDFKALIQTASKVEDLIKDESKFRKSNYPGSDYPGSPSSNQTGGEVAVISPGHPPIKLERQQRAFSDLGLPLSIVYKKALAANLVKPLEPKAPSNPLPKSYNANEYCEYHQGAGHKTDACKNLRHRIQDLVDSGDIIPIDAKPNINTNPLPRHSINHINDTEPTADPTSLITLATSLPNN